MYVYDCNLAHFMAWRSVGKCVSTITPICIAWLLAMLAFGAVNCYGLISGYVGVRSRFKLSNVVELWMRVLFYTIIITIFVAIKNPDSINWKQWLGAFSRF